MPTKQTTYKKHSIFPSRNIRICICCGIIGILATSCGINARIKKADKKYNIGEYYTAGEMYKSIYGRISYKDKAKRAEIAYKQADCYKRLNHRRTAQVYNYAIRNNYPDSIVYLRYAQVLQQNGKYADAAKQYKIYLESNPDDPVALDGLEACEQVSVWRTVPSRYKVRLATDFNAKRSSTFAPAFIGESADALIFTSNRNLTRAIGKNSAITGVPENHMYSVRKNVTGKWEEVEKVEGLTSENDEGVCSFTADGKTMYFTRSISVSGSDCGARIYMSSRAGGEWSEPQSLTLFQDSTITTAHPSISPDGLTLYFVSDAPGGFGGNDIWRATYEEGEWKAVENLGPEINTSEDEMFPTLRNDTTLYFSSRGHAGYGGLDLFKAVYTNEHWQVENMGQPFNTNGDDFGITFAGATESGFFSSNRNDKKGYDAIYAFELPELVYQIEGKVTDYNGEPITDAYVRIVGSNGMNAKIQAKKDGSYRFKLAQNTDYVMLASCRGFLNQKQDVSTQGLTDSKSYKQDVLLTPISKPVTMDNIFYEFGKWDITPDSEASLLELVKLLNDNPNITIELSAHTDKVGNAEQNKILSEKRAQSVVNFLISKGIEKERLTPIGYGKEKPVVADKALHDKYPFIPIDTELNEAFIDSLTPEQQEIANQINRRTEFKVLKTTYKLF